MKELHRFWLNIYKNFPRVERGSIGKKIDLLFIELLELIFNAIYLPPDKKILLLIRIIYKIDLLKFFTQLAWEYELIKNNKYSKLLSELEEQGRMFWKWRKDTQDKIQNKTPAH